MFDLLVVVVAIAAASAGWRAGAGRVLLPIAAAVGVAFVAARVGPSLIARHTSPAEVTERGWLAIAAFVVLPLVAAMLVSAIVAALSRAAGPGGASRLLGALLACGLVAGAAWILAPVSQRQAAFVSFSRDSTTARIIDDLPPPPIDIDDVVARGVVPAQIAELIGSPAATPPPTELPAIGGQELATLRAAAMQVFAMRCREPGTWSGSGFVVGQDTIVTNAHVVSGEDEVEITSTNGQRLGAEVVLYDAVRDLAVLRTTGLRAPALRLATNDANIGDILVSATHPRGDEALHVAPARVDTFGLVRLDLPPAGPASRLAYGLASADLAQGSSGGPIVNTRGEVVAVNFAGNADGHALAFSVREIEQDLAHVGSVPVSTGAC